MSIHLREILFTGFDDTVVVLGAAGLHDIPERKEFRKTCFFQITLDSGTFFLREVFFSEGGKVQKVPVAFPEQSIDLFFSQQRVERFTVVEEIVVNVASYSV